MRNENTHHQPRSIIPQNKTSSCDGDKETATLPLQVFIYRKGTRNASIRKNVNHVKVHNPSVKEIRDYAFIERWSLVDVEFSEGLKVIGRAAFYSCQNLKRDAAFHSCRNLDSIEFPEGLQVIGKYALTMDALRGARE
jgi:hypothetical protein